MRRARLRRQRLARGAGGGFCAALSFGFFVGGGSGQDGGCDGCNLEVPTITARAEGPEAVVEITVANSGKVPTPETSLETISSAFEPVREVVPALQAGAETVVTIRVPIPDDVRGKNEAIGVRVDPDDAIPETSEGDNANRTTFFVPDEPTGPDLTAARVGSPAVRDRTVEIRVRIENTGNRPAPATLASSAAPEWDTAVKQVDALDAGATQDVVFVFAIPEGATGSVVFTVRADSGADVEELSEDNNTASIKASLRARPPATSADLVVAGAKGTAEAEDVVLTASVRNDGEEASPATAVEASSPGWPTRRVDLPGIAPGRSESVTFRIPIPDDQREATHDFTLEADPGGLVPGEPTRANNVAIASVLVPAGGLPDLIVTLAGEPLVEETAVVVVVQVRNDGAVASPPTTAEASAPGWETETQDVPALDPDDQRAVELTMSVPENADSTDHELTVTVDPDNDVDEESDANNVTSAGVTIPENGGEGFPLWPVLLGAAALLAVLGLAYVLWNMLRPRRSASTVAAGSEAPLVGRPPARVVNTGFALDGNALSPDQTLQTGSRYDFWLDVGEAVPESIERVPTPLPGQVPDYTTLTVALFSLNGGLRLDPDRQMEKLWIGPTGSDSRIAFPVWTPEEPDEAQLRCSIYHDRTLVQSRVIRALVTTDGRRDQGALESVVDYTLAPSLDPAHLRALPQHRLSVMLNRNGDGSHGFTFVGEEELKSEASFRELELQNFVRETRGALRHAAWGDEEGWEKQKRYLYEQLDPDRFRDDLVKLAVRGFRVYAAIANRLGEGDAAKLNRIMRSPGFVQIASKESPTQLLPAALIYDYIGLRTTEQDEDYSLCEAFLAATRSAAPLEETSCFQGGCPSRGKQTVICPSGFWGFRHALGVPVSVLDGDDAAAAIGSNGERALTIAVSTDPGFVLRERHEGELRELFRDYGWNYASTREDTLRLLRDVRSQIVYFYCHGGMTGTTPYIQVGPVEERGITADLFFSEGIHWLNPRPLVFINGCGTTALEPEQAIEFVSQLVQNNGASGVIGTEITVFEPLAGAFAKECLARFLAGQPIGEAVRRGRLALLKQGNPLGLVYIPFVLAGLRLHPAH